MNTINPELRAIFWEALDYSTEAERQVYLDRVCEGDGELRARVEVLLHAHRNAGDFLEQPALPQSATLNEPEPVDHSEQLGIWIGLYQLLERIGEGGMGTVYMAEQSRPLRRRVALKVINPGMDTKQVIARFEAERQALAMMDHPNIAKIFDGGATPEGRPYFVMELVRGIPMTEYCDLERLSIPERLELFITVCRAVQHAHQKGIIHRDLKPSNVLVTVIDGQAVPKVIDFGVAKAMGQSLTDQTLFTGFHQFIGTPLYMSPEQASFAGQDVDTRSDVYSLGVLLYELLTGTTPFDREKFSKAAIDELKRIIREEDPPKPSTRLSSLSETRATVSANRKTDAHHLDHSVRGDLDWIVMKALDKDRRRRYETANDFASDITRHLTGHAVEARPPSTWYRMNKFAHRNRAILIMSGVIALSLVAATIVSTWQAIVAVRARREAATALATARRAVDEMYTQVAEKWLANQPKLTSVQIEFLEKAETFYQQFAEERSDDLTARIDAIDARLRAARIQEALGRTERAESTLRKVIAELRTLSAQHPADVGCSNELGIALSRLADICGNENRFREAESLYKQVITIFESLISRSPEDQQYRRRLAANLHDWGVDLDTINRVDDAESTFRRAHDIYLQLHKESPQDQVITVEFAKVEDSYGRQLGRTGKKTGSKDSLRQSLQLREELLAIDPMSPSFRFDFAVGLINLNVVEADGPLTMSRPAEGETDKEMLDRDQKAFEILSKLAEEFPDRPNYRKVLCQCQANYAMMLYRYGRVDEARTMLQSQIDASEKLAVEFAQVPDYRFQIAYGLGLLVIFQTMEGDLGKAINTMNRACEIYEDLLTEFPSHIEYRRGLKELCEHMSETLLKSKDAVSRNMSLTIKLARRLCELDPENQFVWKWRGLAEYCVGDWDAAIHAAEKCISLRGDEGWAFLHLVLAAAHSKRGDEEKAREWFAKARPSFGVAMGDTPQWFIDEVMSLLGSDESKALIPSGESVR